MLTRQMLPLLLCPTCQDGDLAIRATQCEGNRILTGDLDCQSCGSHFPVAGGVPALMPEGVMDSQEWDEWKRHLDKLQSRREDRIARPDRTVTRWGRRARPKRAFAQFTGVDSGRVLDVGCGPGKFRFNFDEDKVEYFGLDPITLSGVSEFPFVRAVAERIPFADNTFTDVFVLAALDHFRSVDAFASEAARTLVPGGRLHILQSIHDLTGPVSLVRLLGQRIKDSIEDRVMDHDENEAPKHLSDFNRSSVKSTFAQYFDVDRSQDHHDRWYTPTKLFLSLRTQAIP